MRLTVTAADQVIVTVPVGMDAASIRHFLQSKADWISRAIESMRRRGPRESVGGGRREYLLLKERAREVITERVRFFAAQYGFSFGRISIRNQKSCWGSCSRRGNLNFNYRLLKLPEALRDYVIVHELCHLKEFNHSPAFWQLVAEACFDYKMLRKKLRQYGLT
jgi:predicted metal-dependent hydrolase